MLKIAVLSDVHIAPEYTYGKFKRKLTKYSLPCIREFLEAIESHGDFAFAVHCGDLIQDADTDTDRKNYQRGVEMLNRCVVPVHHLVGNHDTANLPPWEIKSMLQQDALYYAFDLHELHFVFLHTLSPCPGDPRIILPAEQLAWVEQDLEETDKPTLIFSHHSFADQNLEGNPWFEGRPDECLVDNRGEVRKILKNCGKVIAVMNGHLHWNHIDWHDGIPYLTVQSAIERVDDHRTPAKAWGVMEINGNTFSLRQYGNDPFYFSYCFS